MTVIELHQDLNQYIEHTNLQPTATKEDIRNLCNEAVEHNFHGVCVNPYHLDFCMMLPERGEFNLITVVGFPLGASTLYTKELEANDALHSGADEIDVVMNIGAAKEDLWSYVEEELTAIVRACQDKTVKVIIESGLLSNSEIVTACKVSTNAGAQFVKTSTGLLGEGATVEAVKLMRNSIPSGMGLKASGGIRDRNKTLEMLKAGATRIGTSSGVKIITPMERTTNGNLD